MKIEINVKQELFEFDSLKHYKRVKDKVSDLAYENSVEDFEIICVDKSGKVCVEKYDLCKAEYPIKVYLLEG